MKMKELTEQSESQTSKWALFMCVLQVWPYTANGENL